MALTKAGNIVLKYPHRKNLIINGNFDIWQRGVSFPNVATGTYTADRWARSGSNDGTVSIARASHDAMLGNRYTKYALGITVASADTSIIAGQYESLIYNIEGYDVQQLMGQTITLSFWVYSPLTGTYCVSFRSSPGGTYKSYIAEYTINQANVPEYKTITLNMHDGSSGTWDFTNGIGLTLFFTLACGPTYHTTPNAWQTGNYLGTSNQVNFMSATRTMYFYRVQLEVGSVATPFEFRPFAEELELCQRYYEKSYAIGVAPGTISGDGRFLFHAPVLAYYQFVNYKTRKRVAPTTVNIFSPITGAQGYVRNYATGAEVAEGGSNSHEVGFENLATIATIGNLIGIHWTADAEL